MISKLCLEKFLEGSKWNGWLDTQQQVVATRRATRVKWSCTCVGLDPRNWQTIIVIWSQWTGLEWCSKHGEEINMMFFTKHFGGRQTDLEQCSKYSGNYWRERSSLTLQIKGGWLCHNASLSILNTLRFGEVSVCNTIHKWIAIIKTTRHGSIRK